MNLTIVSPVLLEVAQYLDLQSLLKLRFVCKDIKKSLESLRIWKKLIEKHFGTTISNQLDFPQAQSQLDNFQTKLR